MAVRAQDDKVRQIVMPSIPIDVSNLQNISDAKAAVSALVLVGLERYLPVVDVFRHSYSAYLARSRVNRLIPCSKRRRSLASGFMLVNDTGTPHWKSLAASYCGGDDFAQAGAGRPALLGDDLDVVTEFLQ